MSRQRLRTLLKVLTIPTKLAQKTLAAKQGKAEDESRNCSIVDDSLEDPAFREAVNRATIEDQDEAEKETYLEVECTANGCEKPQRSGIPWCNRCYDFSMKSGISMNEFATGRWEDSDFIFSVDDSDSDLFPPPKDCAVNGCAQVSSLGNCLCDECLREWNEQSRQLIPFSGFLKGEWITPERLAKKAFAEYCAMDNPELPEDKLSALQVRLHRWQANRFGGGNITESALGVNEEVGEMSEALLLLAGAKTSAGKFAHAVLKRKQKCRGYNNDEKYRSDIADAIADTIIFAIQAATLLRLDVGVLVEMVSNEVMTRELPN